MQHVMSKRFKALTPRRLADESCKEDGNLTECARDDVLPPPFCFQAVFTETLTHKELQSLSECLTAAGAVEELRFAFGPVPKKKNQKRLFSGGRMWKRTSFIGL